MENTKTTSQASADQKGPKGRGRSAKQSKAGKDVELASSPAAMIVPEGGATVEATKKGSSTKKPRAAPSHPKTALMVNSAIKELKERGGSSLQAIKKYMAGTYKIDTDKQAPFIRKYLKAAVASGVLVQTKGKGATGSFKLAATKTDASKPNAKITARPAASKKTPAAKKPAATKKAPIKKPAATTVAQKKKSPKGPAAKPPKAKTTKSKSATKTTVKKTKPAATKKTKTVAAKATKKASPKKANVAKK